MIKLSKKGSYALKAVIYIGALDKIVKIKEISLNQNISETLLRRIIADLEKASILKTIKGRGGGVELGKPLKDISVYDILFSVGEELGITDCTRGDNCDNKDTCNTTDIVGIMQKSFNGILRLYTLDKIINGKSKIE